MQRTRVIALVALVAAIVGFVFAAYSTHDYAAHLDRQVHSVHCSFIPGAPASEDGDNACKTALFSPYSAILRTSYWGGIPISLFAMGAFGFLAGLGLLIALAKTGPPRWALVLFGIAGIGPLIASIVMFTISATRLHTFCKLCVGIYVCSIVIASASVFCLLQVKRTAGPMMRGGLIGLVVLLLCTIAPAAVYAGSV